MVTKRNQLAWRICVLNVIALVHCLSFFLPVFRLTASGQAGFHDPVYGFEVAFFGCCGVIQGALGWYANPLFWIGIICFGFGWFRTSGWLAFAGFLLALTSWFVREWHFNESGNGVPISGHGAGFYVWFSSFVLLGFASVVLLRLWPRPLPPRRDE